MDKITRVICADCQFFVIDPIGFGQGIGACTKMDEYLKKSRVKGLLRMRLFGSGIRIVGLRLNGFVRSLGRFCGWLHD